MDLKQPFKRAIIKLAATYTTILAVICLGFSAAVYLVSVPGLHREPPRPLIIIERREEFERFIQERDRIVQADILIRLIIINVLVIASGAVASYFLARWSLQPIYDNLERQLLFISSASHELKTPLAAIQMENEVLLRDKTVTKADLRTQVQSNLEEILKLKGLVSQLLKLTSNETLELINTRVDKVAAVAVKQMKLVAKQKEITIKTELSPLIWQASDDALTEIITILLDNAIKYSPQKSEIIVCIKDNQLMVIDAGEGISETDLPHVFERFYRADKARTSEGYGLGLALAQDLAQKMNLKIGVQNNPKAGATFTVKSNK
ncbi:MAG: sensor histidine kinase [Candidatus Nanosyncoccaceae bacterium]|jgi:signal transduction histidine kinase